MTQPQAKLLPCPFCGKQPIWEDVRSGGWVVGYKLKCPSCYSVATKEFLIEQEGNFHEASSRNAAGEKAIAAWNTRPATAAPADEGKLLEIGFIEAASKYCYAETCEPECCPPEYVEKCKQAMLKAFDDYARPARTQPAPPCPHGCVDGVIEKATSLQMNGKYDSFKKPCPNPACHSKPEVPKMTKLDKCDECGGSGQVSDGGHKELEMMVSCDECGGTGTKPQATPTPSVEDGKGLTARLEDASFAKFSDGGLYLNGIIRGDKKKRFPDGLPVHTSLVVRLIAETANSVYELNPADFFKATPPQGDAALRDALEEIVEAVKAVDSWDWGWLEGEEFEDALVMLLNLQSLSRALHAYESQKRVAALRAHKGEMP